MNSILAILKEGQERERERGRGRGGIEKNRPLSRLSRLCLRARNTGLLNPLLGPGSPSHNVGLGLSNTDEIIAGRATRARSRTSGFTLLVCVAYGRAVWRDVAA